MKNSFIFLSGGGDAKDSFELDKKFFALLNNNSKILYIPIALGRDKIGYEACYDWFSTIISRHSLEKDIDFTMLLEDDNIPNLNGYNAIYVGGGNTYRLLDYVYRKNFIKNFLDFIKSGGIIYGGSAGAIIMGKDIRIVEEENDKNYQNFLGLNLLEGKSVKCHYEDNFDLEIFSFVQKIGSQVLALPENAGLILDANSKVIEIIGEVYIFDEKGKRHLCI